MLLLILKMVIEIETRKWRWWINKPKWNISTRLETYL